MLLDAAVLLLSLAVLVGVSLVYEGLRYRRNQPVSRMAHGVMAISGVSLLIAHILQSETSKYNNFAALLFVLAITGGGLLFALREPGRAPSMPLVAIHAMLALTGFAVLLTGYLSA